MNAEVDEYSEDEEDLEAGTQLLPTRVEAIPREIPKGPAKVHRLRDVWDEGEELFDIGEESDEEGESSRAREPHPNLPTETYVGSK